jgi:cytosine/adenosine deaminase-related metal-dependent hydrolase
MRTTVAVERAVSHDAATARGEVLEELPLTAREVLGLATTAGARFCGLEEEIGSITPGKQADLVLLACDSLAMTPVNNPVGAAVLIAQRSDVDAVLVAGRFVKRDGRLVRQDLENLRETALRARDHVFSSAGIEPHADWMPPRYDPDAGAERSDAVNMRAATAG